MGTFPEGKEGRHTKCFLDTVEYLWVKGGISLYGKVSHLQPAQQYSQQAFHFHHLEAFLPAKEHDGHSKDRNGTSTGRKALTRDDVLILLWLSGYLSNSGRLEAIAL